MKKLKYIIAAFAASLISSVPVLAACGGKGEEGEFYGDPTESAERVGGFSADGGTVGQDAADFKDAADGSVSDGEKETAAKTAAYVLCNADGLNIRAGAGTSFKRLGTACRGETFCLLGEENGFYATAYRGSKAYLAKKYCTVLTLPVAGGGHGEEKEAVIAEGTKLLGSPYVYGAVRMHDGKGNLNGNFNPDLYDCSSLMQAIFFKGVGVLLNVNTRTQVLQGAEVQGGVPERGDLIFFTNDSRANNVGVERVGHVALYLGGGYILHTSSDYAKIEKISDRRQSYFICARRVL